MSPRIKLYLRLAAVVVTITSIFMFAPWRAAVIYLSPLPDSIQPQVDVATKHGLDGIVVYVDQAGKEPRFFTAGWKNRAEKIPADPKALFKLASINKLYLATSVAKLVHSGQLSLEGTVAEYFPAYADKIEYADRITLRMLVQHRSGIPNFTDHPDFPWDDPELSIPELMELVYSQEARFEPGTDYAYSNTNYFLISQLIDSTVGYNHLQYIREEILNPLGLTRTFGSQSEIELDELTSGYYVGYEPDIKTNNFNSMLATADDVGTFLRALNTGTLLNPDEQEIYSSIYEYGHTGLLPGYSSIARYHTGIDTVVVQFVNTSGGNTWPTTEIIYSRILKILRKQANKPS